MPTIDNVKVELNKVFQQPKSLIKYGCIGCITVFVIFVVFIIIPMIFIGTSESFERRYLKIDKDIEEVKELIDEGNLAQAEIKCYLISYADTTDTKNYLKYENQKKELLKLIEQKKYEENKNGNN